MPGGRDPGRADDVEADVPFLGEERRPDMEADPKAEVVSAGPFAVADRALDRERGVESARGGREREAELVTGRVDLVPFEPHCRVAHEPSDTREDPGVGISGAADEARRALDVREQERHRPGREAVPHRAPSSTASRASGISA